MAEMYVGLAPSTGTKWCCQVTVKVGGKRLLMKQTSVLGLPNSSGFSVYTSGTGKPGGRGQVPGKEGKHSDSATVWRVETHGGEDRGGAETDGDIWSSGKGVPSSNCS